jgi:type III pantothenate kinase
MRVLAIDAGNTRIKWGLHDGEGWLVQDWIATARAGSVGSRWVKLGRPEFAIACNVAGAAARRSLAAAARRRLGVPLEFVSSRQRQCGVVSSYDRPAQLGADRWAALIGAWRLFRGACVVVNVGTTMTVDAQTGEGVPRWPDCPRVGLDARLSRKTPQPAAARRRVRFSQAARRTPSRAARSTRRGAR